MSDHGNSAQTTADGFVRGSETAEQCSSHAAAMCVEHSALAFHKAMVKAGAERANANPSPAETRCLRV
jgi:hypothetical protein